MELEIIQLESKDIALMNAALDCFGEVFEQAETYNLNRPSKEYLASLIAGDSFVCLVAMSHHEVVGALAAYELKKTLSKSEVKYISTI